MLRYMSTNEGNVGKCVEQVNKHMDWLEGLRQWRISDAAADLMKQGVIYIGGRDKNGYPSCIFF